VLTKASSSLHVFVCVGACVFVCVCVCVCVCVRVRAHAGAFMSGSCGRVDTRED